MENYMTVTNILETGTYLKRETSDDNYPDLLCNKVYEE